jgi:hypothetical protein
MRRSSWEANMLSAFYGISRFITFFITACHFQPAGSSLHVSVPFDWIHFIILSPTPNLRSGNFHSYFQIKSQYTFLISAVDSYIILIIFSEEYKVLTSSRSSFLDFSLAFCPLGPNILVSAVFSNTSHVLAVQCGHWRNCQTRIVRVLCRSESQL